MKDEPCYVISYNEDGDPPSVEVMSPSELTNRLNEEYYGNAKLLNPATFDHERDWGLLVIRGKPVLRKPRAIAA